MPSILENLERLCASTGVSGAEDSAAAAAAALLREFIPDAAVDLFGNVAGVQTSKKAGAKTLLLDAHIDEIGLIVTSIDDGGFLKVSNCGGIDRRQLAAQRVTVHGKKPLKGFVGSKPPHLEEKEEARKVPELTDMFVDIGMDKEEAERFVSLGDRITVDGEFTILLNGRAASKAIDDRAGVAVILEALRILSGEELSVNIAVQFSGCEETGGQGAKIAGFRHAPDLAVAVDVSFAHSPGCKKERCGKLGGGPMIGCSAAIDKAFTDKMVRLAKENNIPYQMEVMGGRGTGTNADEITVTQGGVRTALLSVPIRYMHSPVEVVLPADIEASARLMAEFVRKAGEE